MMKIRCLPITLILIALALSLISAALAATNGVYEYRNNLDGGITITAYLTNDTVDLVIPSMIDTQSVTCIGSEAFRTKGLSGHVTLPDSVLRIEADAFHYNLDLHGVSLGTGVTNIAERAFYVSKLKSLVIPDSVLTIGDEAFYYNNISNLVVGTNVTSIGMGAFMNNRTLMELALPDSLLTISSNAFFDNDIHTLTFGTNLTVIGQEAFTQNPLTNGIVLPDSLQSLAPFAFYNAHLTSVSFSSNLIDIGCGAFNRNEITNLNGQASNGILYARNPDGSEDTSRILSYGGNTGGSISNSVRTIGAFAFARNSLASMSLPDTVTTIEESAFWSCGLSRFETGNGVLTIASNACRDNSLTNVVLGSSLTHIGHSAFRNNNLTVLNIPDSVTDIGPDSFMANRIAHLQLGSQVGSIGANAFFYNYIETIAIPDSVTNIGVCAFYTQKNGTNYLTTNLTISANARSIGAWAFYKTGYDEITLPLSPVWHTYVFGSWTVSGSEVVDLNTNQPGIQVAVNAWDPYLARYDAQVPALTQEPTHQTALVGSAVTFTVGATISDGGALSYQWSETDKSNSVSSAIASATNSLFFPDTDTPGDFYYFCTICNSNGAVNGTLISTNTTQTARLTIEPTQSYTNWCIAQGVPEGQRGHHDDPMADGFENIVKYAYGLPAMEPVRFQDQFVLTVETNPPRLSLTYPKSKTAENLALIPIRTDQLTSNVVWHATEITSTLVQETATSETWRATTPLTNGSVFLGVRLELP
ncbi:MAG: leucine-rich repeat domain-containing protein [Kiritimatiellae bacterium]|nr:leucine-rich repeat domain-containing protein [Kiritimatiellia bacterium]MDD4341532.1 leucine-rich repeat domain-containing protein [Kiritimatiellia bacterium]